MTTLNSRQRKAIASGAANIRKQAARMLAAIDDDPMFGDLWSALNRIVSDSDTAAQIAQQQN